jgi:hypothetical protein
MPTKSEWDAIEVIGLIVLWLLPIGAISWFAPELWRTWKGNRPKKP